MRLEVRVVVRDVTMCGVRSVAEHQVRWFAAGQYDARHELRTQRLSEGGCEHYFVLEIAPRDLMQL